MFRTLRLVVAVCVCVCVCVCVVLGRWCIIRKEMSELDLARHCNSEEAPNIKCSWGKPTYLSQHVSLSYKRVKIHILLNSSPRWGPSS